MIQNLLLPAGCPGGSFFGQHELHRDPRGGTKPTFPKSPTARMQLATSRSRPRQCGHADPRHELISAFNLSDHPLLEEATNAVMLVLVPMTMYVSVGTCLRDEELHTSFHVIISPGEQSPSGREAIVRIVSLFTIPTEIANN